MYNSVGVRDPQEIHWTQKAFEMQQKYWGGSSKNHTITAEMDLATELHKQLELVRQKARERLQKADETANGFSNESGYDPELGQVFINCIKDISIQCTDHMILIAEKIISASVKVLEEMNEKPPCPFSAVAIGSLARGEATPYSDLEYLFLLADKSPEIVKYFERLAVTTYFVMGNLRETKLSYMYIEELEPDRWFEDKSKNGFKIDGLRPNAGNIPTGNGDIKSKNHFIVTPSELTSRYAQVLNNPDRKAALFGDFTAMLAYMKLIYSHQSGGELLCQTKAMLATIEPNEQRRVVNFEMLQNDMKKFDFKPSRELHKKGYTVDVKDEIYRFPSLMLYDLSIVFDCIGDSVWETVESLTRNKHISEFMKSSILFQLACACYVRLSTYLYHDSHDDRASVAQPFSDPGVVKPLQRRWPMPGNLLFAMCDLMIPLKHRLANALKNSSTDCSAALNDVLHAEGNSATGLSIKLQTLIYCGWFIKAQELLSNTFPALVDDPKSVVEGLEEEETCHMIVDVLTFTGRDEASSKFFYATRDKFQSSTRNLGRVWRVETGKLKDGNHDDDLLSNAYAQMQHGMLSGAIEALNPEVLSLIGDALADENTENMQHQVPSDNPSQMEVDSNELTGGEASNEISTNLPSTSTTTASDNQNPAEHTDRLSQWAVKHPLFKKLAEVKDQGDDSCDPYSLFKSSVIQLTPSEFREMTGYIATPESGQIVTDTLSSMVNETDALPAKVKRVWDICDMGSILPEIMSMAGTSPADPIGMNAANEVYLVHSLNLMINSPSVATVCLDFEGEEKLDLHQLPTATKKYVDDFNSEFDKDQKEVKKVDLKAMGEMERLRHIHHYKPDGRVTNRYADVITQLGKIYSAKGKYKLAKAYYEKALQLTADLYGKDAMVIENTVILIPLAMNAQKNGERKMAFDHLVRAKAMYESLNSPDSFQVKRVKRMLELLDKDEDISKAEQGDLLVSSLVHDALD